MNRLILIALISVACNQAVAGNTMVCTLSGRCVSVWVQDPVLPLPSGNTYQPQTTTIYQPIIIPQGMLTPPNPGIGTIPKFKGLYNQD